MPYPRNRITKNGRFSDLSSLGPPSRSPKEGTVATEFAGVVTGLTATGTVPDLHRIPFY